MGHNELEDVPIERMACDLETGGLNWRTRIEMIADDQGRPSMRRRGTHVRVPIDTMPLASRALLDVADECHVWDGGFEPGSQIRIAVPEPRPAAGAGQLPRRAAQRPGLRKKQKNSRRQCARRQLFAAALNPEPEIRSVRLYRAAPRRLGLPARKK